jgi:hypothetical protein
VWRVIVGLRAPITSCFSKSSNPLHFLFTTHPTACNGQEISLSLFFTDIYIFIYLFIYFKWFSEKHSDYLHLMVFVAEKVCFLLGRNRIFKHALPCHASQVSSKITFLNDPIISWPENTSVFPPSQNPLISNLTNKWRVYRYNSTAESLTRWKALFS